VLVACCTSREPQCKGGGAALATYRSHAKFRPVGLEDGLAVLRLVAACMSKHLRVCHCGEKGII
jgi:hypothetical protein